MAHLRWRLLAASFAVALTALLPTDARASWYCPFCVDERGPTMVDDYLQASFVIYGTFTNAKLDKDGGIDGGSSDFKIEQVLKGHPAVNNKNMITLPKFVPPSKSKFVVFCDIYNGVINPYRGEEAPPSSELLDYLTSSLKVKDQSIGDRLTHCFKFLNSHDLNVSTDAYRQFA